MIPRRTLLIGLSLGVLSAAGSSVAQDRSTLRRIGFLAPLSRSTPSHPDVYCDAFVQGMRELGYAE